MRIRSCGVNVVLAATAVGLAVTIGVAGPQAAGAAIVAPRSVTPIVADVSVSFHVHNVNNSAVACRADGHSYTVRGDLVGPEADLAAESTRGVTVYLHGLSFGEFFWKFRAAPGYDYASKLARRGQTSLVLNRLGYGTSGKPYGFAVCSGARADIAHQIVQQLRSGAYRSAGGAPRFDKVYLAGHSYGGQIAELEAYSFGDIDGLVVISYTDVGQTSLLRKNAAYAARICSSGGVPVRPGGPSGYAPFGPPSGARAALFHDVDPQVYAAAKPKLTMDPCGDGASFDRTTTSDLAMIGSIDIPVFLVQGGADALFDAADQAQQAGLFTSSPSVTRVIIPHTAHAITLERTRNQFALVMADHLTRWQS